MYNLLLLSILFIIIFVVIITLIIINKNTNKIKGGYKTNNYSKPVIILFNGFASSPIFWDYAYNGTSKLKKINFLKHLNNIGEVHAVELPFFNLNYYMSHPNRKENKKWKLIIKNYNAYNSNINFNIEDLDYKNICNKVHADIIKKFGKNKEVIVIGHSYGGPLALLYSKLFETKLCVVLDSAPYVLDFYKKYDNHELKKEIMKYDNNDELSKTLKLIKKSTNDENTRNLGDKIFKLIEYKSAQNRIKYYDNKLYAPTIFIISINDNMKERNIFNKKCKNHFKDDPNLIKYKLLNNITHHLWWDQKTSDYIIDKISLYLKNN